MLDTLVINIPINDAYIRHAGGNIFTIAGDVSCYGLRTVGDIRRDMETGEIKCSELKHPFESLPSDYDGMAIKFYDTRNNCPPFMMLKASPKIMQGHNVYGTDNIQHQVFEMMGMLKEHYPAFFCCLNVKKAHISRIDATYSCQISGGGDMLEKTNKAIGNIQVGQRKPNKKRGKDRGYHTNYWGSEDSRVGGCKSYGKFQDFSRGFDKHLKLAEKGDLSSKKLLETVYTQELVEFTRDLLRFESETKKEKLHQLGIPSNVWDFIVYQRKNPDVLQKLWHYWFDPIFSAMQGEIVKDIDDDKVLDLCRLKLMNYTKSGRVSYTKAHNAYNFYKLLKVDGWEKVKERMQPRTFRRDVKALTDIGIPRAFLQSLSEQEGQSVPLVEIVKMDFSKQVPDDYVAPTSRYARDFQEYLKPSLKIVA